MNSESVDNDQYIDGQQRQQRLIDGQQNHINGKQLIITTNHVSCPNYDWPTETTGARVDINHIIEPTEGHNMGVNDQNIAADDYEHLMSSSDVSMTDGVGDTDNGGQNSAVRLTNGDINDNNEVNSTWLMDQSESTSALDLDIDGDISADQLDIESAVDDVSNHIKTDISETEDTLTVFIYVSDVFDVNIDFWQKSIEVRYRQKVKNSAEKTCIWRKQLHGEIVPESCSHKLFNRTIELHLKKKCSRFRWSSLEPKAPPLSLSPTDLMTFNPPFIGPQLPPNVNLIGEQSAPDNSWQPIIASTDLITKCESNSNFSVADRSASSVGKEMVLVSDNNNCSIDEQLVDREVRQNLIGRTGLHNLGNTCFMNSVVQCLSNTDPFRSYFVSGEYEPDINRTNSFGSGGMVARTFAEVLYQLWSGTEISVAPQKLKERMGERWAPFSSYIQQDAQEFCAYLLDVLHEDLNRGRERVVTKDDKTDESDEQIDDQRLADESWHRFGLLNNSIVTQLFYGQYKSKLVCPVCGKISVTFDPFVYLSLPLPKPKLEYEVYFFKRDLNGMSTSKPTKYIIKLAKDSIVQNLLDQVSKPTGVPTSSLRCIQTLNNGSIEKFLQPKWTLNKPETGKYLLIFELMSPKPELNEVVSEFVVVQRLCQPTKNENCAKCDKNSAWDGVDLKLCTKCHRVSYCDKECQTEHWNIHRKDCVYRPEQMATPFIITVPKAQLTYRNLCAIIYSYARHSVKLSHPLALNLNEFEIPPPFVLRVYRDLRREETEEEIKPESEDGVDAVDALLDIKHYYIALDWVNSRSFGKNCIEVEPQFGIDCQTDFQFSSAAKLSDSVDLDECLHLHTKPEVLTHDNPWFVTVHSNLYSSSQKQLVTKGYCPQCKESREAVKQITLWRLPNILIIQLKRFSFRNILWREKIDSMVRYPIHGLDMSRYYVRTDNNPDFHPIYDLYGVVNHYGGMFGGHYTSYAKTSDDYRNIGWRCFDDSRVEPINEESVVTRNAYMLYYKLRDNN